MKKDKELKYRGNDIYENLRNAIIKKEDNFYIDSGEVLGQQERKPLEVSLINDHKEKGLISASQHSELVTLFNIRNSKKNDVQKRTDISNIRLETYLDIETAITKTHKRTFLTETKNDNSLYIEMPEIICNALRAKKISLKESKNLFRIHIRDLCTHKGGNFKKDVLKAIRIAYNQNILENMDEVNFLLSIIKDKEDFTYLANNLRLKTPEKKEVNIDKYIIKRDSHRLYIDVNRSLLEEIQELKTKENNSKKDLEKIKKDLEENNINLSSVESEKEILKAKIEEHVRLSLEKDDTITNLEEEIFVRKTNYKEAFFKLSQELDRQEEINNNQKTKIYILNSEIEELSISKKTTISFFKERIKKITGQIEKKETTITQLTAEIEKRNNSSEKNRTQIRVLTKQNTEREKEINILEKEKIKLELESKKLLSLIKKDEENNKVLKEELEILKIKHVKSQMKINHLGLKLRLKKI